MEDFASVVDVSDAGEVVGSVVVIPFVCMFVEERSLGDLVTLVMVSVKVSRVTGTDVVASDVPRCSMDSLPTVLLHIL